MKVKKLFKHFKPLSYRFNQRRTINFTTHGIQGHKPGMLQNESLLYSNSKNNLFNVQIQK